MGGRLEAGLAGLDGGLDAGRVDLHQEVARLDHVAFLHRQAGDLAHDVGADVHLLDRLDLAVGAHPGLDVLPAHQPRLHPQAVVAPGGGHAGDHDDRDASKDDPQLLARGHGGDS